MGPVIRLRTKGSRPEQFGRAPAPAMIAIGVQSPALHPQPSLQHSSPSHASRPSRTTNQATPSDASGSIHQASMKNCATSAPTTTRASKPHVMLPTASVRSGRLPSTLELAAYAARKNT